MRGLAIGAVMLAACGRLGFDPNDSPSPVSGMPSSMPPSDNTTLAVGLVAHLPFDGSFIDLVSDTDAECSGAECPSFTDGVNGQGAMFDGSATCIHVPWLSSWMPAQYTVAAWIRPTSMTGPVVVREHDTTCPSPSLQSSDAAVGFVATDVATGHQEAWSAAMLSQATWTHVAIEFDGAMQSVFVDGSCACDVAPTLKLDYATYEVTIGCYPASATFYDGAIDDVRIYDRTLTGEELVMLAGASGDSASCAAACATSEP